MLVANGYPVSRCRFTQPPTVHDAVQEGLGEIARINGNLSKNRRRMISEFVIHPGRGCLLSLPQPALHPRQPAVELRLLRRPRPVPFPVRQYPAEAVGLQADSALLGD